MRQCGVRGAAQELLPGDIARWQEELGHSVVPAPERLDVRPGLANGLRVTVGDICDDVDNEVVESTVRPLAAASSRIRSNARSWLSIGVNTIE